MFRMGVYYRKSVNKACFNGEPPGIHFVTHGSKWHWLMLMTVVGAVLFADLL